MTIGADPAPVVSRSGKPAMRHGARRRISGKWVCAVMVVALSIHLACRGPKKSTASNYRSGDSKITDIVPPIEKDTHLQFALSKKPDREFLLNLARNEPKAVLQAALRYCESHVHDYQCVLTKQERLEGTLNQPQTIAVLLHEQPKRVLMTWVRNPGKIRRALYVEGRHIDVVGNELFEVEPTGAIARTLVGSVMTEVRNPKREAAGLGSIDQLGFRAMLREIVRVSEAADRLGLLDLVFASEDSIDGRPTLKLVRQIRDPERVERRAAGLLVLHLDQEWLVPVSVHCYGDQAGQVLSRSYVFTDVRMNPGLAAGRFTLDADPADPTAQLAAER